ncbi:response regulator [Sporocytophaga sp.]|uniref:response regulator n=1 Tax=Sporocytophaga sp. TaxID=2231183 RepID=UPI0025E3BDF0|nr:response regulator [Sporocytophaga sp.]
MEIMEKALPTVEKLVAEKGKTILAIDDVESTLDIINCTLCKKYNVVKKANGKEAFEWMHEGNIPDLIICDLRMPEMDGFEFIKHIRSSGFFREVPLLILSSYESSSVRIQCLKCGADDFMMKPFNPEELEIRVENIFKRIYK